jgi:voltage-gated potassium channel
MRGMANLRDLVGMGGVPPRDNADAYLWERRLHWVMVLVALLALPSFYLEAVYAQGMLHGIGRGLDGLILAAFTAEFLWMLRLTRQRGLYVLHNWLNLLIIISAAFSLWSVGTDWFPLARLVRLAYVSMVLARALAAVRQLLTPASVPFLLGWGVLVFALGGGAFYWLEPTVHSFGEGLWLAFVTGSTVGYGDVVPTTTGSRVLAVFMVLVGFAMLSLVTASFVAYFIGEDEKRLRHEMHQDIKELRLEVAKLRAEVEKLSERDGK